MHRPTYTIPHKVTCPACGATNTDVTSHTNAPPRPGDILVCVGCGSLNTTDGPNLRQITEEEQAALPAHILQELARFEEAAAALRQAFPAVRPTQTQQSK